VAKQPLLSIVITSYTMKRLKDIFELMDSITAQTVLTQPQAPSPQSKVLSPKSTQRIEETHPTIEVIFVAEGSRDLYERVKEYGDKIGLPDLKVLLSEKKLELGDAPCSADCLPARSGGGAQRPVCCHLGTPGIAQGTSRLSFIRATVRWGEKQREYLSLSG
jgi:hypothetical protein